MLLSEAKRILKDNGFLCENSRGKSNIEDFNKMKTGYIGYYSFSRYLF